MERRRITVGGISSTWEQLLKTYKCENGNGNGIGNGNGNGKGNGNGNDYDNCSYGAR